MTVGDERKKAERARRRRQALIELAKIGLYPPVFRRRAKSEGEDCSSP